MFKSWRTTSRFVLKVITQGRAFVIIIGIVLASVIYVYNSEWARITYDIPPPPVDATWVRQFMGNVSSATGIAYRDNSTLDALASERYGTAVLNPTITHFGANTELPPKDGEVIYYPVGYSPLGFVQGVQLKSPLHWKVMASYGFTQYGYHLGQGETAFVSPHCLAPELSGPNINVTQFYAKYNCNVTWAMSIWLVIDMSK